MYRRRFDFPLHCISDLLRCGVLVAQFVPRLHELRGHLFDMRRRRFDLQMHRGDLGATCGERELGGGGFGAGYAKRLLQLFRVARMECQREPHLLGIVGRQR